MKETQNFSKWISGNYLTEYLKIFLFLLLKVFSESTFAENIQIEINGDETYSIEVARIDIGDTITWRSNGEGHNVEFFAGPEMTSLPIGSEIDTDHSVIFDKSGIYLYGCTPHANTGMIGLVVVGDDLHNLEGIKNIQLSVVAKSVIERLLKKAQSN
tara:strand:+ start:199 stop:669 length:471 start_codon:yes stop_codon:yes gene_type:complete